MKSSFCIDLQRFMLIPTKFPLSHDLDKNISTNHIFANQYWWLQNMRLVLLLF